MSDEPEQEHTEPEGNQPEGAGEPQGEPKGEQKPADDEPLGEKGIKALREERDARKGLEKKLEQLEKLAPLQKLADALGEGDPEKGTSEIEQRLSGLEAERVARYRLEVAHDKGLTAKQAERLSGSTREELEADADALLQLFPSQPAKRFQGTAESGARKGSSGPTQLSAEDMSRMSADEIDKAHREGRFSDLVSGK